MRTLLLTERILDEIVSVVAQSADGLETGVSLFGTNAGTDSRTDVVLAIAGPGRTATHEPAHYSADENHAAAIYCALRSALPGIRWLGELHVHPRGMTWLSHGDLRTVRQILTGTDATLHPDEFIAGVMQRRNGTVDIYPFHFTKKYLKGREMELRISDSSAPEIQEARQHAIQKGTEHDRPSVCTESRGSRAPREEARGNRWLRKWRECLGRYGRKVRDRENHAR